MLDALGDLENLARLVGPRAATADDREITRKNQTANGVIVTVFVVGGPRSEGLRFDLDEAVGPQLGFELLTIHGSVLSGAGKDAPSLREGTLVVPDFLGHGQAGEK